MSGLDYSDKLKGRKILLHIYEAEIKWRENSLQAERVALKPPISGQKWRSDNGLVALSNEATGQPYLQEIQIINRQRAGDMMFIFKMTFPLNKILDIGRQIQSLTTSRKRNNQTPLISPP